MNNHQKFGRWDNLHRMGNMLYYVFCGNSVHFNKIDKTYPLREKNTFH